MKLHINSTIESVKKNEVSVIAIFESILASFMFFKLAWEYGAVPQVIFSIALSPLLLLRTSDSTDRGLRIFKILWEKAPSYTLWLKAVPALSLGLYVYLGGENKEASTYFIILYMFSNVTHMNCKNGGLGGGAIIIATISKILATTISFVLHPINSISSIPNNWYKIVFCMDSEHPPELLPGIEVVNSNKLPSNSNSVEGWNTFKYSEYILYLEK